MKLGRLAKISNRLQNDFIRREIQGRVKNFGLNEIELFFGLVYNGYVTTILFTVVVVVDMKLRRQS